MKHPPRNLALTLLLCATAGAQPVVSNTYETPAGAKPLAGTPITVSRIGAGGDFTKGICPSIGGKKLPAQVDVLRRAPDGSIRHALVSFVVPESPPGGRLKIDWLNEAAPAPPEFEWGFDIANFDLQLRFVTRDGTVLVSDLGNLDTAPGQVSTLHDGPIMKEFEIHDVPVAKNGEPDPHLDVIWRLRTFTGQKSVRVAAVVERCKSRDPARKEPVQYKFKSIELRHRDRILYQEGAYDHLDQTRYRILAWTDGPLENLHRRPDYDYWLKGKFFPRYRFTAPTTAEQVDQTYTRKTRDRNNQQRKQGILESGMIHPHMPGTGGRWEMEPYPAWSVAYLMSGAPKTYRAILHADGNGAGAFYIHVRQDSAPGYDIRSVPHPPLDRPFRINLYELPDGEKPRVQPDHAHAPSLGYVSYLLTGDKFYAEEASFWASYQAGEWPHKGVRWQQMDRSFAYGFRHVVDAAFILPDKHPLLPYFTWAVNDCLDQMNTQLVQSGRRVHSPIHSVFRCSGRADWVNARRCSAWQYAWVVWSLGNAADKGFEKAEAVRNWAAEYIVGFYTSDDEFKAPDGKTYRYDPKDAIPYSTAVRLLDTKIVEKDGKKRTVEVKDGPFLENYGAIWYYTKLNIDNSYNNPEGLKTAPDSEGNWPLRDKGWGHGFTYSASKNEQKRWWGWHRYGAWVGLVSAVDAAVPKADEAWKIMKSLASPDAIYGYEMLPSTE